MADRKAELEQEEAAKVKEIQGKCYVPSGGGSTYTVGFIKDLPKEATKAAAVERSTWSTATASSSGAGPGLTAEDVVRWCTEDPTVLHLCNRGLGDADMEPLCRGLQAGGAETTSLDLSSNAIADTGVQRLVTALASKACPQLAELRLGGNSFGPLGRQMLQAGLGALRKGLVVHLEVAPSGGSIAPSPPEGGSAASGATEAAGSREEQTQATQASLFPTGDGTHFDATTWEWLEDGRGEVLQAAVPLPDSVGSMADLDLTVSADRLIVRSTSGECLLDAEMPKPIDPDSAQASFSRKRRTLKITLCLAGSPAS